MARKTAVTREIGRGGESKRHLALKEAAFLWAQREGMRACGMEIGLPNCSYRADVAACEIGRGDQSGAVVRSAVFECKQSRADLLNDNRDLSVTLARLDRLRTRRLKLERLLAGHYPHLRQGDSLFAEYETVEIADLKHSGYRRTVKEIAALENQVYGGTKFDRMVRWGVADLFYLVIPQSLVVMAHAPAEWGILVAADEDLEPCVTGERDSDSEREREGGADESSARIADLKIHRRPVLLASRAEVRLEMLHRIAVSGTWRRNRELKISRKDLRDGTR